MSLVHDPHHLPSAQRTLPGLLQWRADTAPERTLVHISGKDWTVAQLQDVVARRATALQAAGVTRGDRVALLVGNRAEFLEVALACGWMGAIAVPINTASRGEQLQHILNNSGAQLMVIEQALWPSLQHLRWSELALEQLWVLDGEGESPAEGVTAKAMPAPGAEPMPAYASQP